jgi:hypothetical protein
MPEGYSFASGAGARLERRPHGAGWLSDGLSLTRTRRMSDLSDGCGV